MSLCSFETSKISGESSWAGEASVCAAWCWGQVHLWDPTLTTDRRKDERNQVTEYNEHRKEGQSRVRDPDAWRREARQGIWTR